MIVLQPSSCEWGCFQPMSVLAPALVQIRVQFNSVYCGDRLDSINLPNDCYILGIIRRNQVILANQNPIILDQDFIVAVAINPAYVPSLKAYLMKLQSVF